MCTPLCVITYDFWGWGLSLFGPSSRLALTETEYLSAVKACEARVLVLLVFV